MQNFLTGLKLALIGGLLLAGFSSGQGSLEFFNASSEAFASFWVAGRWSQMGVALLWVLFAYSGWNASVYLAEELKQPARTLPRSLLLGTTMVLVLYLLLNLFFFYAAPVGALQGEITVGSVAIQHLWGAQAATWLSLLISLALLSSLSAYILIGPRVYFAMARDQLFFQSASQLHPRFQTPAWSIVAQSLCAGVMILTGTFSGLLTYIGFALNLAPWLAVAGLFILRRREPNRERPYRVWGYPVVPLFYLVAMVWIMVVAFVNSPWPSLAALGTVAAGIPAYRMARRKMQ